ncbi:hypothetical protein [uncultured Jannaschia sp.]|uniref:type IV pilus modification PilV family protein n=1 Tax=uncultured Jannaschia sp. TaxID=293347 RepID=UPI002636F498|nr:hypothetical protein [uncultured Jannaschia sp.]
MTNARDEGFVLLETLVAFLVLAVGLTAAIGAVSQATLAVRGASEASRAADLAREVATVEMQALTGLGATTGEFEDRGAWRLVARELPDGGAIPLLAVTIEIRPAGASRAYRFESFALGAAP